MDLLEELATFSADPAAFVLWAFPWGEAGTELADAEGPEQWQWDLLSRVRDGLLTPNEAILEAIASGHGIGKSALVSWLVLWAFSTRANTRGVVTANTQTQLRTKTWAELNKWFRAFIARELFDLQATVLRARDPDCRETWRIDQVTWSEENTEAFAGLHNKGGRILIIFDEASGIPQGIWEVASGALTDADTEILWFAFGNPTLNSGAFYDIFHKPTVWTRRQIDSRTVRLTNHKLLQRWIDTYGIDSDYCRVRIPGQFPQNSALEFISPATIAAAVARPLAGGAPWDTLVLGVDVARQGEDDSVLFFRRGFDARSIPPIRLHIPNLMTLAGVVAQKVAEFRPAGVFIDEGGIGAGLVDRLRQLNVPVHAIQFGAAADLPAREGEGLYKNKRSEMYGSLRRWLGAGGCIPDREQLRRELGAPMYAIDDRDKIVLEKKRDIKARLGFSPDESDALALTFASPVRAPQTAAEGLGGPTLLEDYDPMTLAEVA